MSEICVFYKDGRMIIYHKDDGLDEDDYLNEDEYNEKYKNLPVQEVIRNAHHYELKEYHCDLPILSILIPTLETRNSSLYYLMENLGPQISDYDDDVELLFNLDNGKNPTGMKRNELIQRSKGKFLVFLDDDDNISNYFLTNILKAINENKDITHIGYDAIYTQNFGSLKDEKVAHYSMNNDFAIRNGEVFRPIFHICPIRTDLVLQVGFENSLYNHEDILFAEKIKLLLTNEYYIHEYMYFYNIRTTNSTTTAGNSINNLNYSIGLK